MILHWLCLLTWKRKVTQMLLFCYGHKLFLKHVWELVLILLCASKPFDIKRESNDFKTLWFYVVFVHNEIFIVSSILLYMSMHLLCKRKITFSQCKENVFNYADNYSYSQSPLWLWKLKISLVKEILSKRSEHSILGCIMYFIFYVQPF